MLLSQLLADNSWTVSTSPADGHCLLHSVVTSFGNQFPETIAPTMNSLCDGIVEYVKCNADVFIDYGFTKESLFEEVHTYIYDRHFNCDFVDLAPIVIAKILDVDIRILDTNRNGEVTEHIIQSAISPPKPVAPPPLFYIEGVTITMVLY